MKMLATLVAVASAFVALPASAELKVVASTQDLAAITEAIGGDRVSVSYIARGDLDPHFINAKPSYMVKLANADMVVSVGMELEIGWLPPLLTGSRNPKIQVNAPGYVDASTAVAKIEVPTGAIDRSRGDLHPFGNPHYWLDPENGRGIARLLASRLTELDPAGAAAYKANEAKFETELTAKEKEWTGKMAPLKGTPVIGYHSTFDYFCARYGLPIVGFLEPKPGIPPTPGHTLELSAKAKASGVKLVLVEPYHDARSAEPLANATGAKVITVPTSVGAEDGIKTYFDLFDSMIHHVTTGT